MTEATLQINLQPFNICLKVTRAAQTWWKKHLSKRDVASNPTYPLWVTRTSWLIEKLTSETATFCQIQPCYFFESYCFDYCFLNDNPRQVWCDGCYDYTWAATSWCREINPLPHEPSGTDDKGQGVWGLTWNLQTGILYVLHCNIIFQPVHIWDVRSETFWASPRGFVSSRCGKRVVTYSSVLSREWGH